MKRIFILKLVFFIFSMIYPFKQSAQPLKDMFHIEYKVNNRIYNFTHRLYMDYDIFMNRFSRYGRNEIFIDSLNSFSRLIISSSDSIDIPTVPLSHLIILGNKELIVGLSSYVINPYNVVIYNLQGELLYKELFGFLQYKVERNVLKKILKSYPTFKECFRVHPNVFKDSISSESVYYYFQMTYCNTIIPLDSLSDMKITTPSLYFPDMRSSTASPLGDRHMKINKLYYFINESDPFHDLIMVGNIPYMLILNNYKDEKVYIPLVSNCDILKEIEEW